MSDATGGAQAIASNDGEQLADVGRGIQLCYETFGDRADPPLLLIMGLGMQMVHWQLGLVARLVERGHYVVRFDNRDRGCSTHMRFPRPSLAQLVARRFGPDQYCIEDMANDTVGLLDALELDSAHVVGVSMGGMIAQTVAATRPDRVRSLTSIMSTTGSRLVGQPRPRIYPLLFRPVPRERAAAVDYVVAFLSAIGVPSDTLDTPEGRAFIGEAVDRDPDEHGTTRQLAAIVASGNRTRALRSIAAPTLVIHGDSDPLIPCSGGRATAKAIPDAKLMIVPGMGHGLPERLWPLLVDAIAAHAARAEERRAATTV